MTGALPAWSERFHDATPGAPRLDLPGGVTVTRSWAYGDRTGSGVRVAVVDSGIEAGHPLVGPVSRAVAIVSAREGEPAAIQEGPHDDLYGHGTACAGIIRALAPQVELVSVRVLGANLKGNARAFAHGLEWCIDEGIDVVNLSLSTSNPEHAERFHELVDAATYRGMVLVSAMSNERKTTIPSEFAGVFSVACAPAADMEHVVCRPGAPAEWGARGIDVEVAWLGGGSIVTSGNSFAAAVIAGHLARIRSAHPRLTPWQLRTVLAELAELADDTGP